MAEWDEYINQVLHKMNYDTNEWDCENVCSAVAIYGHDGNCWAYSPTFPELTTYDHEIEDMGGNKINVPVNEVDCAKLVGQGTRNPCGDAGIRLGNAKYMFVRHDDTGDVPGTQLSKQGGGGAAIANCNTASVIALVEKDAKNSKGGTQTHAEALVQVVNMAKYLQDQGY